MNTSGLLADLAVETRVLDHLLRGLPPAQWGLPTPAEGWAIRDQVSHLAFFDEAAVDVARSVRLPGDARSARLPHGGLEGLEYACA